MRVFLIHYSYHKSKWSGRVNWPPYRSIAESEKKAKEELLSFVSKGCGFRIESIEDVTGKPHEIRFRTCF